MESQPETTLVELIRYNNWANAQILAACQKLTAEQLAAAAPGAYGTIHDTLGHIIAAEADYVGRMTGDRPPTTVQVGRRARPGRHLRLRRPGGRRPARRRPAHPAHPHRP